MSSGRLVVIPPAQGQRFELARGETLRIIDIEGGQVADLMALSAADPAERLSSGRSLDYNGTLFLTTGNVLYSNRSNPLLSITEDTAGRHDFLFSPCSQEMFAIQYGATKPHPNCLANLARCLAPEGIEEDAIPTPFNAFMHVDVDPTTGTLTIQPPSSGPGDHIDLVAERDLVVALAACSAEHTNQGRLKPIGVRVLGSSAL
jgi:uncharacterized protein YcgI (DUF1989 family)